MDQSSREPGAGVSADIQQTLADLQEGLAETREQLAQERQEKQELRERVEELEEQQGSSGEEIDWNAVVEPFGSNDDVPAQVLLNRLVWWVIENRRMFEVFAGERGLDDDWYTLGEIDDADGLLRKLQTTSQTAEAGEKRVTAHQLTGVPPLEEELWKRRSGSACHSANARRATIVWEKFKDDAMKVQGQLVLNSKQVRNALKKADEYGHSEHKKRSMEWAATLSNTEKDRREHDVTVSPDDEDNILQLRKRKNQLELVADQERITEVRQTVMEQSGGQIAADSTDDASNTGVEMGSETAHAADDSTTVTSTDGGSE